MEHLVTTLETAQKLKAAGFPQGSANWWIPAKNNAFLIHVRPTTPGYWAAPTAQEIADELPSKIMIYKRLSSSKQGPGYSVGTHGYNKGRRPSGPTMAEALAALWLTLHTEGKS